MKTKEAECLAEYLVALDDDEKFFFQKAKVDWISNGDRNTKYFHKVIASKRNINRIMSVCNEDGERFHEKMVNWIMTCVTSAAFTIGINGERYGYFKSGRGLRQGDPISPYLFTRVMEIFTLMLARRVNKKFKFHKGCKEMQLTHLSFADDLLVLCHGDEESVKVIKEALMEFMGKLPVKYLGIPIIAKKLGINDCKQLVEKVKNIIQDWNNSNSGRSKVAWTEVCCPKQEGGLGLKQLGDWNEVLLSKQVWKIIAKKDGVWVKWVNLVKLKGKSFWVIDEEVGDSGTWKALLDLKYKIRHNIIHVIGNDNWSEMGYLKQYVTDRDIHDARIDKDCCVSDMIEENEWVWPKQWVRKFTQKLSLVFLSLETSQIQESTPCYDIGYTTENDKKDTVKWRKRNGQMVDFSIRDVWWDMKCVQNSVPWWKVIWFSQCNPRKCHDSHDHLFFRCEYSSQIWNGVEHKMNMGNIPDKWDDIVSRVAELPLYDGWNRECVKDEPSWSIQYTDKEVRMDIIKGVCSLGSDANPSLSLDHFREVVASEVFLRVNGWEM
ncbi:RNA-directed DNA polymerase, eukaryota, reverse transcriptase zinc-binding domain protein [Tanacetum coccineum]|uniref:RNA-directed DNA polymerase, eukaryota, reverse transcriptase zinc-binding domain protein n=1 Tax=Tanacetum coccineum TaxID=301880 RepID=A0ABQ4WKD3_9ASTR